MTPRDGSMPWARAWYGRQCTRGATVIVNRRYARVLSASDGLLYVRTASGERVAVRPDEATPTTPGVMPPAHELELQCAIDNDFYGGEW